MHQHLSVIFTLMYQIIIRNDDASHRQLIEVAPIVIEERQCRPPPDWGRKFQIIPSDINSIECRKYESEQRLVWINHGELTQLHDCRRGAHAHDRQLLPAQTGYSSINKQTKTPVIASTS